MVSEDSDLAAISEKLRLVSINEEPQESTAGKDELLKSDEELARMLQVSVQFCSFLKLCRLYFNIDSFFNQN